VLKGLATTSGQVLTLFLLMAVGFALKKLKKVTKEGVGQMTFLVLYAATPCLILRSMQVSRDSDALKALIYGAAGCLIYYVIGMFFVLALFRKNEPDVRDTLRFGSLYTNNGFMGFPLVAAMLGAGEGAAAATLSATGFLIVNHVIVWTHGYNLMCGSSGTSSVKSILKQSLINPGIIAFLIGAILFALNLMMPSQIYNAVSFVADLNTPLAMIVVGTQMADADLLSLFSIRELYLAAGVKLIVLPVAAAAVMWLLKPAPIVYAATIILCATPTAGNTSMFAQRFDRDTKTAGSAVTFVTLLSIITLPTIAAIVMKITGISS